MNTLLVAAGSAMTDAPEPATLVEDWRRDMSVGHRLPGGRMILHSAAARWCDLCERQGGS